MSPSKVGSVGVGITGELLFQSPSTSALIRNRHVIQLVEQLAGTRSGTWTGVRRHQVSRTWTSNRPALPASVANTRHHLTRDGAAMPAPVTDVGFARECGAKVLPVCAGRTILLT